VIRIVDKSYYSAHTERIFKKLNLLKSQDIQAKQKLKAYIIGNY